MLKKFSLLQKPHLFGPKDDLWFVETRHVAVVKFFFSIIYIQNVLFLDQTNIISCLRMIETSRIVERSNQRT